MRAGAGAGSVRSYTNKETDEREPEHKQEGYLASKSDTCKVFLFKPGFYLDSIYRKRLTIVRIWVGFGLYCAGPKDFCPDWDSIRTL